VLGFTGQEIALLKDLVRAGSEQSVTGLAPQSKEKDTL
jgi:hypothetical protein